METIDQELRPIMHTPETDDREISIEEFVNGAVIFSRYDNYPERTDALWRVFNSIHKRACHTLDNDIVNSTEEAFFKYARAIRDL